LGAIVSGIKRLDPIEQREAFVLSNKNVQALRTLFNISYQLNSVLGPTSWILVGLLSLMGGTFFYLDTVSC
jgi:hypothetical protein